MTKYPSFNTAYLLEGIEYDFDDAETDVPGLPKGSLPFAGVRHFNEMMLKKMRPKKVAKFRISRKMDSDL